MKNVFAAVLDYAMRPGRGEGKTERESRKEGGRERKREGGRNGRWKWTRERWERTG